MGQPTVLCHVERLLSSCPRKQISELKHAGLGCSGSVLYEPWLIRCAVTKSTTFSLTLANAAHLAIVSPWVCVWVCVRMHVSICTHMYMHVCLTTKPSAVPQGQL